MASDPHPRYVVREISGYHIRPGRATAGNAHLTRDLWIYDRWYHRVVATFYAPYERPGWPRYKQRKARAEKLCAELNAEHDAWLAAG